MIAEFPLMIALFATAPDWRRHSKPHRSFDRSIRDSKTAEHNPTPLDQSCSVRPERVSALENHPTVLVADEMFLQGVSSKQHSAQIAKITLIN